MNILKFKKILVVSHDAGGAEVISSFIKKNNLKCFYKLSGPAIKIFKSKIKKIPTLKNKSKLDLIVTGTSLKNSNEIDSIKYAKLKKIYSISFLDHWVNYKNRFVRNKKIILPDEMILGDRISLNIAKKEFKDKKVKLKLKTNEYLKNLQKFKNNKSNNKIVYLSSNMDSVNYKCSDKYILLRSITKISKFLTNKKINEIIIRKHPSESSNKYKLIGRNIKKQRNIKVSIDNSKNLSKTLSKAKYVFGHETMGLVVAKLLKKYTFNLKIKGIKTTIPPQFISKYI